MKLEAVHLIQFFAYERFTLSPGESTGIFGANGSGKSSFLDAVQIAMFGANSNLTALNAQADESTKSYPIDTRLLPWAVWGEPRGPYPSACEHVHHVGLA